LQAQQPWSPLQSASLQSLVPSQSLSNPSAQVAPAISRLVGAPQSSGQSHEDSVAAHSPSPQQRSVGSFVQVHQFELHRKSAQETGFTPPPAPQQNHPEKVPYCLPLQSAGHVRQSSPSPASHTLFPHSAPVPPAPQSSGQLQPDSPLSHAPLPQQLDIAVCTHSPEEQRSVVQESLSSHSASPLQPQLLASNTHEPLTQRSTVQAMPSLQASAVPLHAPFAQRSFVVQALPSLQAAVLLTYQHTPLLQESLVHGFPSLQLTGVPAQTPPEHASPVVQALPSLHAPVELTCRHVPLLQ
jgi:hypothetical protein